MGLFSQKSPQEIKAKNKIKEITGLFIKNTEFFNERRAKHNLAFAWFSSNYKGILEKEYEHGNLRYEDIEKRMEELMDMDLNYLQDCYYKKKDTSIFKTQEDINRHEGPEYVEKYYRKYLKTHLKETDTVLKEMKRIIEKSEYLDIDIPEEQYNSIGTGTTFSSYSSPIGVGIGSSTAYKDINWKGTLLRFNTNGFMVDRTGEGMSYNSIKEYMVHKVGRYPIYNIVDNSGNRLVIQSHSMALSLILDEKILKNNSYSETTNNQPTLDSFNNSTDSNEFDNQITSSADELLKWHDLLEKGIINQEEFDAKKKQLLGL